jgi:hypothetical protein
MLNKFFSGLKTVVLPELTSDSGEKIILYTKTLNGSPTGELCFSEKMRAHNLVIDSSSYKQKFSSTTYGGLIKMPLAFACMIGMEG